MAKTNKHLEPDDFFETMPAYVPPVDVDQLDHQAKVVAIATLVGLIIVVLVIALMVSLEIATLR